MRMVGVMLLAFCLVSFVGNALAADFFAEPEKLCNAVASELGPLKHSWGLVGPLYPNDYQCSAGVNPIIGPGNSIAYYVNGTRRDRVDNVKVILWIKKPKEREVALNAFIKTIEALFRSIGEPIPKELRSSFKTWKPVTVSTSFGKVEVERRMTDIESFGVVLTGKKEEKRLYGELHNTRAPMMGCPTIFGCRKLYEALSSGNVKGVATVMASGICDTYKNSIQVYIVDQCVDKNTGAIFLKMREQDTTTDGFWSHYSFLEGYDENSTSWANEMERHRKGSDWCR